MRVPSKTPLEPIVGKPLAAVIFIMDYIQLQFDGGLILTAVTLPTVEVAGRVVSFGEQEYRDELCARIGKVPTDATARGGEEIKIVFSDGSKVSISLRPEDRRGAEAAILGDGSRTWTR
jgi:hypothetical protein